MGVDMVASHNLHHGSHPTAVFECAGQLMREADSNGPCGSYLGLNGLTLKSLSGLCVYI